jgi:tight adherence protein C
MSLFSNNMVQADTMGISIVNVLKAQAEALRVARRRRAETLVQKAPVKMLFPLVFFVFPTMLLVLLGPAIINIEKYL